MSSTLGPDVVLETLGKTESAFGVDLSHFDACEQPGINLAESSRESSSSLKVNHPQIPDFSADSKETFSFLRILLACLQVNQHTHVGLRDFIRKSLQPVLPCKYQVSFNPFHQYSRAIIASSLLISCYMFPFVPLHVFMYLLAYCPRAGLFAAAADEPLLELALLPSPGWASLWQSFALFPLSSLRQAKKY